MHVGRTTGSMSKGDALPKEDRRSIRANPTQKGILARARHMNVSQFVLQASLQEAERVVCEEWVVTVSPEEYLWLSRMMDEALPAPRLWEALAQKPVWDA